ncbi:putative asparagine--tRNA ligase, mitochondrial, partial [Stegodyphus mimosarum]
MLRARCVFTNCFKAFSSCVTNLTVKDILLSKPTQTKIVAQGWVRAIRKHKNLYFVDLVDGTCHDRLQIVIPEKSTDKNNSYPAYGSSVRVEGLLIPSTHKGQEVELIADTWDTLGSCANDYPFEYRQKYSEEYVRQFLHLRPRTRRFSSILRIENHAAIAVHKFFQDEGFCFMRTPIITQNDCEGAGETFYVECREKKSHLDKQNNEVVKDGTKKEEEKIALTNPIQSKPE